MFEQNIHVTRVCTIARLFVLLLNSHVQQLLFKVLQDVFKHTRLIIFKKPKKQINKRACMFESSLPVIKNAKSAIKHTRSKSPVSKNEKCVKHVCMFENPLPVMENETYTLKHTRLIIFLKSLSVYVCLTPVSMYVCLRCLSMYVCLQACMYV